MFNFTFGASWVCSFWTIVNTLSRIFPKNFWNEEPKIELRTENFKSSFITPQGSKISQFIQHSSSIIRNKFSPTGKGNLPCAFTQLGIQVVISIIQHFYFLSNIFIPPRKFFSRTYLFFSSNFTEIYPFWFLIINSFSQKFFFYLFR